MCLISSLIKSYIPGKCFLRRPAGKCIWFISSFLFILSYEKMSHGKKKNPKQTFAVIENQGNSEWGKDTVALFKIQHLVRVADQTDNVLCIRREYVEKIEAPGGANLALVLHICRLFVPSCSITGFLIVFTTSHFPPIRPSLESLSPHF